MKDQHYKLRICLAKPVMREMLHYYLIIINNYLIIEMCTCSHQTQPKLPLKRVTVSVAPTHALFICEYNQSIPN